MSKSIRFTLNLFVLLLFLFSTTALASVLADQAYVSNNGSINGVYTTAGGFPHYNITASSSASVISSTVSSSQVDSLWVNIILYRNDVLITSAASIEYHTKYVSKSIYQQEYGEGTWLSITQSKAVYIDSSEDRGNDVYASKYFSVQ